MDPNALFDVFEDEDGLDNPSSPLAPTAGDEPEETATAKRHKLQQLLKEQQQRISSEDTKEVDQNGANMNKTKKDSGSAKRKHDETRGDTSDDSDAPTGAKKVTRRGEDSEDGDIDAEAQEDAEEYVDEGFPVVADSTEQSVTHTFSAEKTTLLPGGADKKTSNGKTTKDASSNGSNDTTKEGENGDAQSEIAPKEEGLVIRHQVRHQVALPKDYPYVPISQHVPPKDPARTYPFTLDPFQATAIHSIQRNESVLVAAHTSAGKTVVAEYAIAQSLRNKQRVIYTSPIKALSNQKYRELAAEFGDVGLMTGDVSINPDAGCLVMTTEILRSMLYRGSEVIREVAWIVFDEIHYMRDKVRGVVWEETIILLPNTIQFVFLSATIPNAMQFAEWICKMHNKPCHVVYTDFRPTPLQHYLFPAKGDGIHLAVDEKGQFREENFQRAISAIGKHQGSGSSLGAEKSKGKKNSKDKENDLYKILKMIMSRNYHPVIVFAFSKRECESNALQISKMDLNTEDEKEMVDSIFKNAIESLSEDDRALPQIEHILPLLKRGIGIHHSGLLPILKELIEILFQEGLLKVLFATETFSIGLNMPAKTVVFTSVRKWDGKDTRWLEGGEYIQMSGRAGRRGLDDRGIVILMVDEKMEPDVAKKMLKGVSDPLNSAFHLTYTTILNLLRIEGISPVYILERSFYQFQTCAKIPEIQRERGIFEKRLTSIAIEDETKVAEYFDTQSQLTELHEKYKAIINNPKHCLNYLQAGRLVRVKIQQRNNSTEPSGVTTQKKYLDFGYGVILSFYRSLYKSNDSNGKKMGPKDSNESLRYVVEVCLKCAKGSDPANPLPSPDPKDPNKTAMMTIPCLLDAFDGLSSVRIKIPNDMNSPQAKTTITKIVGEVERRFPQGLPLLDGEKDMKINDEEFKRICSKKVKLQSVLESHPLHGTPNLQERIDMYSTKLELASKIDGLQKDIGTAEAVVQLDELKAKRRVLRRLGYVTQEDVVEMKGRIACEISAGDELVLTEMIFNGHFNELSVDVTVALLSCFVFDEKSEQNKDPHHDLQGPLRMLRENAAKVARVCKESKMDIDEKEYVDSFRCELMDITYAWCQGAKFKQICKMTDVFEGSIIRAIRRLEELLRQLATAAKLMGNSELETKFTDGIVKIKRDIIFAASLYL